MIKQFMIYAMCGAIFGVGAAKLSPPLPPKTPPAPVEGWEGQLRHTIPPQIRPGFPYYRNKKGIDPRRNYKFKDSGGRIIDSF